MSHRSLQIIDAFAAALELEGGAEVFKHRLLSVSENDSEVPALSVCVGEDRPLDDDGVSNLAFIDSLLSVRLIGLVREDSEEAAVVSLAALRTIVHRVAMAGGRDLGLSFVTGIFYAGAAEPQTQQGDRTCGRQEFFWNIQYRMNITDPE